MRRWLLFLAYLSLISAAQAAVPRLESVSPGVGQRGATFELKLVGAGLDDVAELICYRSGIVCEEIRVVSTNELSVRVRADDDCHLGSHPFRLRSPRGLSELRTFRITPFNVVASVEPNDTAAAAQSVNRNVTITGVAGADDLDCYRVSLKAGEFLSVEVEGVRLGGSLVDTKLELIAPNGQRIAQSDDTPLFQQDPFLTIEARQDGDYLVQVSETNRDGDDESRYALHLGSFPRPKIVYPAGGESATTVNVKLLGDARGEFMQKLFLPAGINGDFEVYPTDRGQTAPTSFRYRVVPIPNVLESEPNDSRPNGSAVTLPHAFNGIVQSTGDRDRFAFIASAGETWRFELFGDRIGSALDAVMAISDNDGRVLVRCDDWESHDGQLDFTVPHSGDFVLTVTDKREAGGPLFVYRVEATAICPRVTAFLPRPNRLNQDLQTICVPRGNRVMAYLGVQRQDARGDAFLTVRGAPDGVSLTGGEISEERFWVPVIFQAAPDAPLAGRLADVDATMRVDGRTVFGSFRQVVDLVGGPADALYHSVEVDRVAMAVIDAAPVTIDLLPPSVPLAQDGTLSLKVVLKRQPGFSDPVDVTFPLLPPWVDGPASLTLAGDQTEGIFTLRSWPAAAPRHWKLCAEARPGRVSEEVAAAPEPGRRRRRSRSSIADFRVASELVELDIAASPVAAEPVEVAGFQGEDVPLVYRLTTNGPLLEKFIATLEGLPNRVSAEPVPVDPPAGELRFLVRLESSAPLGEFQGITCRISGEIQGQAVSYLVGRKTSLIVTRPGELVRDADGKPLSQLEVLRRKQRPAPNDDSSKPLVP